MDEQKYFDLTNLEERIKKQLRENRKKSKLTPVDVADRVGKSTDTYRRWESRGKHLTCIYDLAEVFKALNFTTTEIIHLLDLPPLTFEEIKAMTETEEMLEEVKESGIYFYIKKQCADMKIVTISKLLVILAEELERKIKSR
ncbi:helix-turn-helix transcriptional regulator [Mediterraneibacter glycyrrhizinilyticus]|uniref:helix-turn-helix transcriptional regulator n=1 Tax=Mediterraneibacter glycyrrhizinilyticus TaxID=342942 RepID=UPI0006CFCE02